MGIKTKKTRNGLIKKELKFKHGGKDYIVVIHCTKGKLDTANEHSKRGIGTELNSAYIYDMTSFRENN